jgi:hypothetical protein
VWKCDLLQLFRTQEWQCSFFCTHDAGSVLDTIGKLQILPRPILLRHKQKKKWTRTFRVLSVAKKHNSPNTRKHICVLLVPLTCAHFCQCDWSPAASWRSQIALPARFTIYYMIYDSISHLRVACNTTPTSICECWAVLWLLETAAPWSSLGGVSVQRQ